MSLTRKQEDFLRLLASKVTRFLIHVHQTHIGTKHLNYHMKRYVSHRGEEGAWILNLDETW